MKRLILLDQTTHGRTGKDRTKRGKANFKTDRNDARGIAQMIRVGLYRPVHVKTLRSQKLRMLLTHRKLLQSKAIAVENDLRATLRNFGLLVDDVAYRPAIVGRLALNQVDAC
jgi:transposase